MEKPPTNFSEEPKKTGVLQTAFPIVQKNLGNTFTAEVDTINERYPQFACPEFKGRNIGPANKIIYIELLNAMFISMVNMADSLNLHTIVSFQSKKHFWDVGTIANMVGYVKSRIVNGPLLPDDLIEEFCCQVYWLYRVLPDICSQEVAYDFEMIFDNKGDFAKNCDKYRMAYDSTTQNLIAWPAWEYLTNLANDILNQLNDSLVGKPIHRKWLPRIKKFTFVDSTSSRQIQASDLLCHLYYNSLKFKLGDLSENAGIKYNMLVDFLTHDGSQKEQPINPITESSFKLVTAPNTSPPQKDVECTNPDLTEDLILKF